MGWASRSDLDRWFGLVEMDQADVDRATRLNYVARVFAESILSETSGCADQSAALRHVRQALWAAIAALASRKRLTSPNAYVAPEEPGRETEASDAP